MTVHVGLERKSNWTEIRALQEKQCIVILQLQIKDIFLKDSNLPNRPIFMDSKHKLKPKFLIFTRFQSMRSECTVPLLICCQFDFSIIHSTEANK